MLKLITLNIEMNRHYDRVLSFLEEEKADVVCLQEAPEEFQSELQRLGFQTSFAPMFMLTLDDKCLTIGVLIATRDPHTSYLFYYHRAKPEIVLSQKIVGPGRIGQKETRSFPCLIANITINDEAFIIGTTHGPVTGDGKADTFQTKCITDLISTLQKSEPHILCGDFNIPRGYNALYEKITEEYRDTIPREFTSSLDRTLHASGGKVLDVPIFDIYMTDYIFSQLPYVVDDVQLKFGVSDHAAIIANISKKDQSSRNS